MSAFSTLTQVKGRDDRMTPLLSFSKLLIEAPPDAVLVENVPGLNTAYGREAYDHFSNVLTEAGFTDAWA